MKINRKENSPIELKQGGDRGFVIKAHSHNEVSIGFILNGEACVTIDKEEFSLKEMDIILIPNNRVHLCHPKDIKNYKFKMLYIDSEWLSKTFNIDTNVIKSESCRGNETILNLLNEFSEKENPTESDNILLLDEILTGYFKIIPYPKPPQKKRLEEIKCYLEKNYLEQLLLDELSEKFSINKYHMIRSFKKQFGLSPHSYIVNLRINKSKEMLKKGFGFTQIANDCAFYDQSHFIKTFRDYTGLTPDKFK